MIKQPLFGQDSSPHVTSMFISAIATLVCWIIFCILCLVVKFKPQAPEYKEIQIVLESTPVVERSVEEQSMSDMQQSAVPEPVEGQAPELPNPVETPVAEAKVEAPKKEAAPAKPKTTTQPKTKTTTKTTDPSKKVDFDNIQYATDYSDFDFNNTSSKSSNSKNFDWSQFDDSSSEPEPAVSQKVDKVTTKTTIDGNMGTTKKTTEQRQKSTDATTDSKFQETPSALTQDLLKKIKNATYSSTTGDSSSIVNMKSTNTSDGKTVIAMENGSVRTLFKPRDPIIKLSEKASKEITNTLGPIKIRFKVLPEGNVPRGEIEISQKSLFTYMPTVYEEVLDQISNWIFEPGDIAYAILEYTIEIQ